MVKLKISYENQIELKKVLEKLGKDVKHLKIDCAGGCAICYICLISLNCTLKND